MQHKIVFVGGVHGVGKTTLCTSICLKLNVVHHSASELIKRYSHIEFQANGRVENIVRNQDALIGAINVYLDTDRKYLLDGHFCLLDQNGVITRIPMATFTLISPMAIILLQDDPRNIYFRLQGKDKKVYDIDLLSFFQDQELRYSELVAAELNIPYLRANPFSDHETVDRFIADRFG